MSELERITIAKNIAANGRTFCALLCAICIAVYLDKRDAFHLVLAIVAALPIGLAYINEGMLVVGGMKRGFMFRALGIATLFLPIVVIVNLLFV